MKIITYIRKCNPKQLAEFLCSSYYSTLNFELVFANMEIKEQAKLMCNDLFHQELASRILFGNTHYIDAKTIKLKAKY